MKVKQNIQVLIKMIGIVTISSIVLVGILYFVYKLPRNRMVEHVVESENTIRLQNDDYNMQISNYFDTYDTDTNIIMLLETIAPNINGTLQDALLCPSGDYFQNQWGDWADTLMNYANDAQGDLSYVNYARYWHGYLVFLKPLLMFMNVQDIYYLHAMLMVFLTGWIFCLLYKRLGKYCIAYAVTIIAMNPVAIAQSFQLSTIYYAMQLTLLLLLYCKKEKQIPYIFLIDGMLVAFFDFLTYPLVAFAIPVLTYYLLYREDGFLQNVKKIVGKGVSFLIGYAGLWFMKWIWATAFTHENILRDGWINVLRRTGTGDNFGDNQYGMVIGPMAALRINFHAFVGWTTVLLGVIFLVGVIAYMLYKKQKPIFQKITVLISFLVACSPILWYVVVNNHASLHPHLEWREWVVSVFAACVLVLSLLREKTDERISV